MVVPMTLAQQMATVTQQFFGLVSPGSQFYYTDPTSGQLQAYIVTGGIDPKTGQAILQSVHGGGTVLLNTISVLYPGAVAAPTATAAVAAASAGGTSIGSIAQTGLSALGSIPVLKGLSNKNPVGPVGVANGPSYVNGGGFFEPPAQQISNLKGQITSNFLNVPASPGFPAIPYAGGTDVATLLSPGTLAIANGNAFTAYDAAVQALKDSITQNTDKIFNINESAALSGTDLSLAQQTEISGYAQANSIAQSQLNSLVSGSGQTTFINTYMTNYNNAVNELSLAQTQQVAQQTFTSINGQISGQASSLFSSLPADQQQAFMFNAAKELQSAKLPSDTNATYARAQQDYISQYQLTSPQDQAAVTAIVKNAAANDYALETGDDTTNFNTLSPQVQSSYMQAAYNDLPNNPDYQNFMASRQQTLGQAAANKANSEFRSGEIQLGIELAAAAGAGYAEENAIADMFENGFSAKNFIVAILSGVGMFGALHLAGNVLTASFLNKLSTSLPFGGDQLGSLLNFITSLPGLLVIQGLIVLLGWLLGKKPSPEQVAAETLNAEVNPEIWNPNGQVIFLTAGLTMASLGVNLSPSAPMMQTMTLSQAAAITALQNQGPSTNVPTDSSLYADVFVQQGSAGAPTIVEWVNQVGTDAKGNAIVQLNTQKLAPGMQFASSQPTSFIPFFKGTNPTAVNPQVVQALDAQQHLLQCADGTWVTDAQRCATGAGATSHPMNPGN